MAVSRAPTTRLLRKRMAACSMRPGETGHLVGALCWGGTLEQR